MRVGQPWLCYTRLSLLRKTLANQGVPSLDGQGFPKRLQPPSGGCVLKLRLILNAEPDSLVSRLRAAAC